MAKEKITLEQFMESVDANNKTFVQELHKYLMDSGCNVAFEEKKNGYLASYKYGKPPKAVMNFLFRKQGMLTRIYGERISGYPNFLNALPAEMVNSIESAGVCKQLVHNTCSPKCTGYDFMIGDEHFQKCRYNCFEFLMIEKSRHYIQKFVEHELTERQNLS